MLLSLCVYYDLKCTKSNLARSVWPKQLKNISRHHVVRFHWSPPSSSSQCNLDVEIIVLRRYSLIFKNIKTFQLACLSPRTPALQYQAWVNFQACYLDVIIAVSFSSSRSVCTKFRILKARGKKLRAYLEMGNVTTQANLFMLLG